MTETNQTQTQTQNETQTQNQPQQELLPIAPVTEPTPAPQTASEAPAEAKRRVHTPDEIKGLLKEYQQLKNDGKSVEDAAALLKVPYITLRMWERKAEKAVKGKKAKVAKVAKVAKAKTPKVTKKVRKARKPRQERRIVDDYASTGVVLVTPDGFRFELTADAALALYNAARSQH